MASKIALQFWSKAGTSSVPRELLAFGETMSTRCGWSVKIGSLAQMSLKEKIQENFKKALKEKKEVEISTLRMLNAAIINREKEKRYKLSKEKPDLTEKELEKGSQLTDGEITEVIFSEVKKRKEAIVEFERGEREDLAEKEKKEMGILMKYLPEQLSEEEIKKLAKETIEKIGAESMKDLGKVMGQLMPKVKGKAEGSSVSKIVKELLSS